LHTSSLSLREGCNFRKIKVACTKGAFSKEKVALISIWKVIPKLRLIEEQLE
jgi:hypothetical protein